MDLHLYGDTPYTFISIEARGIIVTDVPVIVCGEISGEKFHHTGMASSLNEFSWRLIFVHETTFLSL